MNFIEAIKLAEEGKKIRSVNWNYDEFIFYEPYHWYNPAKSYAIMPRYEELIAPWEIFEGEPEDD